MEHLKVGTSFKNSPEILANDLCKNGHLFKLLGSLKTILRVPYSLPKVHPEGEV